MAQVMYYTENKAGNATTTTTKDIPSYNWTCNGTTYTLGPIQAGSVINWSKMKNEYSSSDTDEHATAVATLMKYCGYSVKMSYGSTSNAYINDVADALKTYFGYNKNTTTYVSRNSYTYDKWVDLIYHELANGRPVAYSGQSLGGGHSFVCDGYQYDNGTDYFHINWGWGGQSDQYYALSVLNPYAGQGAGGSSTNDGFHYDQSAVIGIQKSGENGEIANITPNVMNLTLNSMTLSHSSVVWNTEVTVTLNITNNNATDYDGTIYIGYQNGENYELLVGDNFLIRARETRDCALKFKPTGIGTYHLVVFFPTTTGFYSTDGKVWAKLPVVEANSGIPTNLAVTNISSNGGQLSWTENGSATAWKVGYKAESAANFTVADANVNPFTLTGLSPETQYTVKVRPSNGSDDTWSPEFTFTTIASYPAPKNLTSSKVTPTTAQISWTGSANSYDIQYGAIPEGASTISTWLKYDNDTYQINTGWGEDEEFTWGVMYPGSMVTGTQLTKIAFYISSYNTAAITVRIYSGGDDAPGTLLYTGTLMPPTTTTPTLLTVPFDSPVPITSGQNLWITLSEKNEYPAISCTKTDEPNNQWICEQNYWRKNGECGWMIRGYIESENLDAVTWTTVASHTAQSYKLTGLDPNNNYVVQVRSNYASNNHSNWVTTTISNTLELGNDEAKNNNMIEAWNGQTTTVILKDRTLFKDGSWNTLCLPFPLSAEQLAASPLAGADIRTMTDASLSGGTLTLNFTPRTGENAVTSIAAGTPYIIKWTKAEDYEQANAQTRDVRNPTFTGVTISNQTNGITSGNVTFKGTYSPVNFNSTDATVLFLGDNNMLYFPENGAKINACRAYFQLDGITAGDVNKARLLVNDSSATEIISTTLNDDGLQADDHWYDLSGRRLSGKPSAKGIYIRGGRKVVIK